MSISAAAFPTDVSLRAGENASVEKKIPASTRQRMLQLQAVILEDEKRYKSVAQEITSLHTSPPSPNTLKTTFLAYLQSHPHIRSQIAYPPSTPPASPLKSNPEAERSLSFSDLLRDDASSPAGEEAMDGVEDLAVPISGEGPTKLAENERAAKGDAEAEEEGERSTNTASAVFNDDSVEQGRRQEVSLKADPSTSVNDKPLATRLSPSRSNDDPSASVTSSIHNARSEESFQPSINPTQLPPQPSTQDSSSSGSSIIPPGISHGIVIPPTPSPPPATEHDQLRPPPKLRTSQSPPPSHSPSLSVPRNPDATTDTILTDLSSIDPSERPASPALSSSFSSDAGGNDEPERDLDHGKPPPASTSLRLPSLSRSRSQSQSQSDGRHNTPTPSADDGEALLNPPSPTGSISTVSSAQFSPSSGSLLLPDGTSAAPKSFRSQSSKRVRRSTPTASTSSSRAGARKSPSPSVRGTSIASSNASVSDIALPILDAKEQAALDASGPVPAYTGPLPENLWNSKDSKQRRIVKERKYREEIAMAKRIEQLRAEGRMDGNAGSEDGEGESEEGVGRGEGEGEGIGEGSGLSESEMAMLAAVPDTEMDVVDRVKSRRTNRSSVAGSGSDKGKGEEKKKEKNVKGKGRAIRSEDELEDGKVEDEGAEGEVDEHVAMGRDEDGEGEEVGIDDDEEEPEDDESEEEDTADDPDHLPSPKSSRSKARAAAKAAAASKVAPTSTTSAPTSGPSKQLQKAKGIAGTDGEGEGVEVGEEDQMPETKDEERRRLRRERDRARREKVRAEKAAKEEEKKERDNANRKRKRAEKLIEERETPSVEPESNRAAKKRREDASPSPAAARPPPSSRPPMSLHSNVTHLKTPHLDAKAFRKVIDTLFDTISTHRSSSVFQQPIRDVEAPDYSRTVHRAMDLRTIKNRIRDGQIGSIDEFERDVVLMFTNAMLYNEKGSDVHRMAEEMLVDAEKQIWDWRQLQHRLATQQDN